VNSEYKTPIKLPKITMDPSKDKELKNLSNKTEELLSRLNDLSVDLNSQLKGSSYKPNDPEANLPGPSSVKAISPLSGNVSSPEPAYQPPAKPGVINAPDGSSYYTIPVNTQYLKRSEERIHRTDEVQNNNHITTSSTSIIKEERHFQSSIHQPSQLVDSDGFVNANIPEYTNMPPMNDTRTQAKTQIFAPNPQPNLMPNPAQGYQAGDLHSSTLNSGIQSEDFYPAPAAEFGGRNDMRVAGPRLHFNNDSGIKSINEEDINRIAGKMKQDPSKRYSGEYGKPSSNLDQANQAASKFNPYNFFKKENKTSAQPPSPEAFKASKGAASKFQSIFVSPPRPEQNSTMQPLSNLVSDSENYQNIAQNSAMNNSNIPNVHLQPSAVFSVDQQQTQRIPNTQFNKGSKSATQRSIHEEPRNNFHSFPEIDLRTKEIADQLAEKNREIKDRLSKYSKRLQIHSNQDNLRYFAWMILLCSPFIPAALIKEDSTLLVACSILALIFGMFLCMVALRIVEISELTKWAHNQILHMQEQMDENAKNNNSSSDSI
jgi:hypothetical protein